MVLTIHEANVDDGRWWGMAVTVAAVAALMVTVTAMVNRATQQISPTTATAASAPLCKYIKC